MFSYRKLGKALEPVNISHTYRVKININLHRTKHIVSLFQVYSRASQLKCQVSNYKQEFKLIAAFLVKQKSTPLQ